MRATALAALTVALIARPAAAQRPHPPRLSLVSDYTLVLPIVPSAYSMFPTVTEMGMLVHTGAGHGLGWTMQLDLTHSWLMVATGPRYRRWLPGRLALDVGAAVPLNDFDWVEAVVEAGVLYRDLFGLSARAGFGGLDGFHLGLGAKVGGGPGLAAGAFTTIAVGVGALVLGIVWAGASGEL